VIATPLAATEEGASTPLAIASALNATATS
jgi:hypothetical protein